MSWATGVLLTCAFVLLAACTETTGGANSVKSSSELMFLGPFEVVRHSKRPLSSKTAAALTHARTQFDGAYGAMYIRPNGDGWGLTTGHYTLEDAKRRAKVDCDIVTGSNCILYATFIPQAMPNSQAIPDHHKDLIERAKSETTFSNYIVIAKNSFGHTGVSWNFSGQSTPKVRSVAACQQEAETSLKDEEPRYVAAYKKAGLLECKVFGVYR